MLTDPLHEGLQQTDAVQSLLGRHLEGGGVWHQRTTGLCGVMLARTPYWYLVRAFQLVLHKFRGHFTDLCQRISGYDEDEECVRGRRAVLLRKEL